jgi:molecular chaperone DnaJ
LICEQNVSVWDAILGTTISIITIDNKHLDITIPPGTQPDTVMSCNGYGLPNIRSRQRGNILVRIKINMPKNLSPEILATIKQIKDGI